MMPRLTRDRVIIHTLLLIPGIVLLARRVAEDLRKLWEENNIIFGLAPWAGIPAPPKIESIIEYVLLVVTLGAFGAVVLWRMHRRSRQVAEVYLPTPLFIVYELAGLTLALGSWYWGSPELLMGWFLVVLLYPASRMERYAEGTVRRALLIGAGFIIAFGAWVLFTSSWVSQFRFLNDYRDLPEYTVLRDGNLVENREFIAKHHIASMHAVPVCTESEQGVSTASVDAACLRMKQHPFKGPLDSTLFFPPGDGLFFDQSTQTLVANRVLTSGQIYKSTIAAGLSEFDPHLSAFLTNAQLTSRNDLLTYAVVLGSQKKKTRASPESFEERQASRKSDNAALERPSENWPAEIQDFMLRNTVELHAQSHQGRFFHHHAFTYLPILESALSPADRIIPAQYGEGLTRTMSLLLGGTTGAPPTFNEYYALLWLVVAAYLALLTFLLWRITGEAWAAITAPGLALAALFLVGSETLRMAPGFNPVRHFPDLLVFAALALQARKPSALVATLRALSLGFFVWWNREFGLFLVIAALAWSSLDVAAGRDRVNAVRQIVLDLGAVLAALAVSTNIPSDLTIYNLMGVNTPSTRWSHAFAWAALWIPLVGAIVWLRFWSIQSDSHKTQDHLLDIAGIGFIYVALASVYPIWNPSRTHAAVIWLCGVGPSLCLGVWLTRQRTLWTQLGIRWLGNYALAVMIILLGSALWIDWPDRARTERVFSQHKLFDWNFSGLHAQSTAEPGGIEAAVDLIGRHQPEGRILLLSRYDSLLQVLSQRIGALPYIDTPTALVSRDLSERVAELILATPNAAIFVDHDLLKNREAEIYRSEPKLHEISAQRVAGLAVLGATFESIRHCYRRGEIAGVLQVWHRTCPVTPKAGVASS